MLCTWFDTLGDFQAPIVAQMEKKIGPMKEENTKKWGNNFTTVQQSHKKVE